MKQIKPMLCEKGKWGEFPAGENWVFEKKYDGTRVIVYKNGGRDKVALVNRRGIRKERNFPEIYEALLDLDIDFIADGELVVNDNFNLLQQRENTTSADRIKLLSVKNPATLYLFDILYLNGKWFLDMPLCKRKMMLGELHIGGFIEIAPYHKYMSEGFNSLLDDVENKKIEGIVAKDINSRYLSGQRNYWVKFRKHNTADLKVIGYRQSDKRNLRGLICDYNGHEVCVSSGLTDQQLGILYNEMKTKVKRMAGDRRYVDTDLIAEVDFYSDDNHFYRFPKVVRLRRDK